MVIPTPVFEFPRNDADESEGLGDAGIETFRDAPYASCAREAGQNSRDARVGMLEKPVRVTFNVFYVEPKDFPDHDRLSSALESCLRQARDEKEEDFFTNAVQVSSRATIPVLRIADYNTTGLIGPPDDLCSPFNSLLKSKGITNKGDVASGGSFGIGKNASVAVSEMQTVFYSTCYINKVDGEKYFATQGKVVLVSHTGEDGEPRRATGYWGNPEKFRAITDEASVPGWLRRDEVGTSIFCMGFRVTEQWAERMICSLVSNFFASIYRGEMEFEVELQAINRNTLRGFLESPELSQAVETTAHKADLEFSRDLYNCLTSSLAYEETALIDGLGKVRFRILAEKGMPSRVGFVRNGMLITDNLTHFAQPLKRFPGTADFICIVEPADEEAGRFFKQLENPAHNAFSAERISDPVKREAAKKAMGTLVKKLRAVVSEQAGVKTESSSVVDELAHLFGENSEATSIGDGLESNPERYTYKISRVAPRKPNSTNEVGKRSGRGKSSTTSNRASDKKEGGREGEGINHVSSQSVTLTEARNRVVSDNSSKRSFFFSTELSGVIELSIKAIGVNAPEKLTVTNASVGELKKGRIFIPVVHGVRQQIDFEFDEPYGGPIEVNAFKVGGVEVEK